MKLRQQTGIVNDKFLKKDFEDRKKTIENLTEELDRLRERHMHLTADIEKANKARLKSYEYA